MKNTEFTISLSISSLKDVVTAECAWIDTCNMAVLPPIVNPATGKDLTADILTAVNSAVKSISGYVSSYSEKGDIVAIDIVTPAMRVNNITSIRKCVEQFVIYHTLKALYDAQPQAKHICIGFSEKSKEVLLSVKQLLASAQ